MLTEKTIPLGEGRSLFARQSGAGEDIVLVHGALTTSHDWAASPLRALERRYRLTIPDRPGHGLSTRPRLAGTPREQAGQMLAGLDALGVERPLVVAHSYGGLVALAMAEAASDRLAGLVLVSPIAFAEPRLIEHSLLAPRSLPVLGPLLSRLGEATRFDRGLLEIVQHTMFAPAEVPRAWKASFPYEAVLDPDSLVLEGEDAASVLPFSPAASIDLRRVTLPVHVLTGTADRIVEDERQAKALAQVLPQARLTEIEAAGHMLHHSHPASLKAAIGDMTDVRAAA